MLLKSKDGDTIELSLALSQLKKIYVALFRQLHDSHFNALDDLDEDDMLLTIQTYLQRRAAEAGVDGTIHAEWEAFLGVRGRLRAKPDLQTVTPTSDRNYSVGRGELMPHRTQHIIAVYPGSFDPVTFGHLDVIRRAAALFNELILGVGKNPDKQETFSQQERIELLEPHLRVYPNVRAEAYDGLTIDFVRRCGGRVIIRGIRDSADFSSELQQASLNMAIGEIESVFLLTSDQHMLTSSTYIKQFFELGGSDPRRIKRLVPPNVALRLEAKLATRRPAAKRKKR